MSRVHGKNAYRLSFIFPTLQTSANLTRFYVYTAFGYKIATVELIIANYSNVHNP
jgi:hypothetical protein